MFSIVEEENTVKISTDAGEIQISTDCDYDTFITNLGKFVKQKTTNSLVDLTVIKTELSEDHSHIYFFNTTDEVVLTIDFKNKLVLNNKNQKATKFYVSRLNFEFNFSSQPFWLPGFFSLIMGSSFISTSGNTKASTKLYLSLQREGNMEIAEILAKEGLILYSYNVRDIRNKLYEHLVVNKTKFKFYELMGLTKKQYNLLKQYNFLNWYESDHIHDIFRNYIPFCKSYPAYINLIEKIMDSHEILSLDFFGTLDRKGAIEFFTERNYDVNAVINYVFVDCNRQGLEDPCDALIEFMDYIEMSEAVSDTFVKYPRFLRTYHDIARKNKKIHINMDKQEKYNYIKADYNFLAYDKDPTYAVIVPEVATDIVREGSALCHCVGSYIDKVIESKTFIVFMRDKRALDKPLITIEFCKEEFIHIKGHSNRNPNQIESEFIEKYKEYVFSELEKKKQKAEEEKKQREAEAAKDAALLEYESKEHIA